MVGSCCSTESKSGWLAYVGFLAFPEGEAGSRRMLGVAHSLALAGENVVVLAGRGDYSATRICSEGSGSIQHTGVGEYDRDWSVPRKLRHVLLDAGRRSVQWLEAQASAPKAVILYGSSAPMLIRLRSWCSRRKIPLICDVVEWYSPGQLGTSAANPIYLEMQYALRRLVPRCDGVIGISGLLCRYYEHRGPKVVRIPPTLDVLAIKNEVPSRSDGPLEIVYAGVPHRKDLLGNVIAGLQRCDPGGDRFHLSVYGPDEAKLDQAFPGYPRALVRAMGRHTHAQVLRAVCQADFTVLVRPNVRYANAGFPTKVVESLSCGTPVICNLTSDLAEHVQEGKEAIICRDENVDSIVSALTRAASLGRQKLPQMRASARARAEQAFDFRQYDKALGTFIDSLVGPCGRG